MARIDLPLPQRSKLHATTDRMSRLPKFFSSTDIEMVKGVGTVFVFGAVASAMGAGKEIAIAWRFRVSEIVDAYQFTFAMIQ